VIDIDVYFNRTSFLFGITFFGPVITLHVGPFAVEILRF